MAPARNCRSGVRCPGVLHFTPARWRGAGASGLPEIKIPLTFNPAPASRAGLCMVTVSTGPAQSWEVDARAANSITLNGQPFPWEVQRLADGRFHVLYLGRSYNAELVSADYAAKAFVLKINGQRVELQAQDRFDQLLKQLGLSDATATRVNELKAPMPGLIVDIRVVPGQAVQKGDPLLVLEAMKMENILKAPADGTISSIKAVLRANVTKGQVLVQFA